jgi:hypothetical protein
MQHPFELFLQEHHVEALQVSVVAQVRYLTVWNATKGKPISRKQAQKILTAAQQLTGFAYAGELALSADEPVEEQPTLRLRKSTRLLHLPNT